MEISRVQYNDYVKTLMESESHDEAMKLAIGGNFDAFGILQRELLISLGLAREDKLVDIGCGSGRLACKLRDYLRGPYLGIDVVPQLLEFARKLCQREDWQFTESRADFSIPAESETADVVCGFSIFTHLLHDQTYRYLLEGNRVLKPGGKLVFSFLEFHMKSHWPVFEATAEAMESGVLNQFIERSAIETWCEHLGFRVEGFFDGDKPHFSLSEPAHLDDGQVFTSEGHLGQSVCVLVKP